MTNKLIDCFTFYNEIDMLLFRLEYLYETVDKFVIAEATLTFSGNPKELYFENNKQLFEKYQDKIVHLIIDDLPTLQQSNDAWVRERFQRNALDRGIAQLDLSNDDIIIINDLDEIPDRDTLRIIRSAKLENIAYALEQDMYYYNLTCKGKSNWYHAKIVNYFTYNTIYNKMPEIIRLVNRYALIRNGGWHFSYFGDVKFIQNKIRNFSHQEFNNEKYLNEEQIKNQIDNSSDLFCRNDNFYYCSIENNRYLPEGYEQLLKYSKNAKN